MKTFLTSPTRWLVLAVGLLATAAPAAPLYFATTDSYYDVIFTGVDWNSARTAAAGSSFLGRSGQLASVTSQAENDFIVQNFLSPGGFGFTAWIGGYQPSGDIGGPAGGWAWLSNEAWSFTNWLPGEPNNTGGTENFLQLCSPVQGGQWNDHDAGGVGTSQGYVIEYAVPEPSSLALGGMAAVVVLVRRRRRTA